MAVKLARYVRWVPYLFGLMLAGMAAETCWQGIESLDKIAKVIP